MLDRSLAPYWNANTTPISAPKLEQYIATLTTRRVTIVGQRYAKTPGRESAGVVLLRHALALADPESLRRTWANDLQRYTQGLLPIAPGVERLFDPVTTGVVRERLFVAKSPSGRSTTEIVIPVQMEDAIRQLPMNLGWSTWRNVKAVRLIDIRSNELTFNTYMDQIHFLSDPPSLAVFTVDVVALALQYAKYLDFHNGVPPDSIPEYIHKYVLNFQLLEDLQNLWLRNRYLHLIKNPHLGAFDRTDITASIYHNIYGYIGVQYTAAMEELYQVIIRTKAGVTPPERILASLPMASGKAPAYFRDLSLSTQMLSVRQSGWVEYLRDLPWLKLAYHTYALNPEYVGYQNFMRHFARDLGLLKLTRFWASIHRQDIQRMIQAEVDEMSTWMSQDRSASPETNQYQAGAELD